MGQPANYFRIAPHILLDVALGSDALWKRERCSLGGKLTVVNTANKVALYNFLSSLSGTRFVAPRTVRPR
jgi:hypothetical protein